MLLAQALGKQRQADFGIPDQSNLQREFQESLFWKTKRKEGREGGKEDKLRENGHLD